MRDAVVIGAGLAGLAASIRLAQRGAKVTLVTKGIGGLQLGQGTIDALGYAPEFVQHPLEAIENLANERPEHPYARLGVDSVAQSFEWIRELLGPERLVGSLDHNVRIPTALGALRPTALYQPSMEAGIPVGQEFLIVGFNRLKDFYPALTAENLRLQKDVNGNPISARSAYVDLDVRGEERDTTGTNFARALDLKENRVRLERHPGHARSPRVRDHFAAAVGSRNAPQPGAHRDREGKLPRHAGIVFGFLRGRWRPTAQRDHFNRGTPAHH